MQCVAHYDNSTDNLANPDPDRLVHWGEQSWDEMLMGFLETAEVEPPDASAANKPVAAAGPAATARQAKHATGDAR
jgi:hypothetical protein